MSSYTVFIPKSNLYEIKHLQKKVISLVEKPNRVIKYQSKPLFYSLFGKNWDLNNSLKLMRLNSKNKSYPCLNLKDLYSKGPEYDKEYYKKGMYLKNVLKNIPLFLIYDIECLGEIPWYILLDHLSKWTTLDKAFLKNKFERLSINFLYLNGITSEELNAIKDRKINYDL